MPPARSSRRSGRKLLIWLWVAALAAGLLSVPVAAQAEEVGTADFSYGRASAPTGQKPQSKLWFAHNFWWGSLFNEAENDYHIYRFDWSSESWLDTGVMVEPRITASMDMMWDGTHLYSISAGKNRTNSAHSPELRRFSYDAETKTWSADPGFPVRISNGGVDAVVMAKDSQGVLWATFVMGSRVYVTHSDGSDAVWVPKYELPTPGGESEVKSTDISAVIAYDGDKIGVLWSNGNTEKMYWASHADGTDDRAWSLEVAYDEPEGSDNHINLKSLQADSAGRVFAAVKTSMDHADDPLINLLVLGLDGSWKVATFGTKGDDHTRAIVLIDETNREVYMFAAQPCCSGGVIYYKKTDLDDPQFEPGVGTPFIASSEHPKINNPTSTKQNVNSTTGLLVLAGDDSTKTYLHNDITLGDPTEDTTPPDTVITDQPPSRTSSTSASFEFAASEPATFTCSLDGAAATACTSPTTYDGLALGTHTFSVTATDEAGNTDPTPATATWEVVEPGTEELFADDFSSGDFTTGGWVVATSGEGTAEVLSGAVHPDDFGARLVSTTAPDSYAHIRHDFGTPPPSMTLHWNAVVASQTTYKQTFSLTRVYDSDRTKIMTLDRYGPTGELRVWHSGQTINTGTVAPLGAVMAVSVKLENRSSGDLVVVSIDGAEVYRAENASLGNDVIGLFMLGDWSTRRDYDYRVDDVVVNP